MKEFDILLYKLQNVLEENVYVEDNKIRIKNKLKYDVFNMMELYDAKWIDRLIKEKGYED
jgi:hypothetical protein